MLTEELQEKLDTLRNEGNRLFKALQYSDATFLYTQALDISPQNAILFSNRSACYLSQGLYINAEHDANNAIKLDSKMVKGWFRLASALFHQDRFEDALKAIRKGLVLEPNNKALKELKMKCMNICKAPVCSKDILTAEESEMMHAFQSIIRQISEGELLVSEGDILQGTFKQLMTRSTFLDILYPGTPLSIRNTLPQNLKELIRWEVIAIEIRKELTSMSRSATKILEGVKSKGALRGEFMDDMERRVVVTQIAQETLARQLVNTVRSLGAKASAVHAQLTLEPAIRPQPPVTDPLAAADTAHNANVNVTETETDRMMQNQLDDDIVANLFTPCGVGGEELGGERSQRRLRYCVQDEFLGKEWCDLLLTDLLRYVGKETMTDMTILYDDSQKHLQQQQQHNEQRVNTSTSTSVSYGRTCWLETETDESFLLSQSYPALAEAIVALHALPYELNARSMTVTVTPSPSPSPSFMKAAKGATRLVHYPPGSQQPVHRDNGHRPFDGNNNGPRVSVSCAYYITSNSACPKTGESSEHSDSTATLLLIDTAQTTASAVTSLEEAVEVVHDRLVLYNSVDYLTKLTTASSEYFVASCEKRHSLGIIANVYKSAFNDQHTCDKLAEESSAFINAVYVAI
eukprot:gene7390-15087_t